jgi:hypothetical protein
VIDALEMSDRSRPFGLTRSAGGWNRLRYSTRSEPMMLTSWASVTSRLRLRERPKILMRGEVMLQ